MMGNQMMGNQMMGNQMGSNSQSPINDASMSNTELSHGISSLLQERGVQDSQASQFQNGQNFNPMMSPNMNQNGSNNTSINQILAMQQGSQNPGYLNFKGGSQQQAGGVGMLNVIDMDSDDLSRYISKLQKELMKTQDLPDLNLQLLQFMDDKQISRVVGKLKENISTLGGLNSITDDDDSDEEEPIQPTKSRKKKSKNTKKTNYDSDEKSVEKTARLMELLRGVKEQKNVVKKLYAGAEDSDSGPEPEPEPEPESEESDAPENQRYKKRHTKKKKSKSMRDKHRKTQKKPEPESEEETEVKHDSNTEKETEKESDSDEEVVMNKKVTKLYDSPTSDEERRNESESESGAEPVKKSKTNTTQHSDFVEHNINIQADEITEPEFYNDYQLPFDNVYTDVTEFSLVDYDIPCMSDDEVYLFIINISDNEPFAHINLKKDKQLPIVKKFDTPIEELADVIIKFKTNDDIMSEKLYDFKEKGHTLKFNIKTLRK